MVLLTVLVSLFITHLFSLVVKLDVWECTEDGNKYSTSLRGKCTHTKAAWMKVHVFKDMTPITSFCSPELIARRLCYHFISSLVKAYVLNYLMTCEEYHWITFLCKQSQPECVTQLWSSFVNRTAKQIDKQYDNPAAFVAWIIQLF